MGSTFETQNMDLWEEVSKDLLDVAPMYGMGQVDYATSKQVAQFYVDNYTDVKFNNPVWLPGIDTLTMKPDGSVRAYGTWTGKVILQEENLVLHRIIILISKMVKLPQLESILTLQEW